MHSKYFLFILALIALPYLGHSQEGKTETSTKFKPRFYLSWGWNRSAYTTSDIRFQGSDYDFRLDDVVAHDRQTKFGFDPYFYPTRFSIPQTNSRLSVEFKPGWMLGFGNDHMKYVMDNDQTVNISGNINRQDNTYNGSYENDPIVLTNDFLTFEHTDGLNYVNLCLQRRVPYYKRPNFRASVLAGAGIGFLLPRTNTKLMDMERYDEFHLAGYGLDVSVGTQLLFWNHIFVEADAKTGYINMPDIRTTASKTDRAKQHFAFAQWNVTFGYSFFL